MKTCSKCNTSKIYTDFNKRSNSKDGYRYECKECQKLHYNKNSEHYKNKMKENRLKNISTYTENDKIRYENNKENILDQKKVYYENNRDNILKEKKEYYKNNKDNKKEYNKKYSKLNKKKLKEYAKEYQKKRRITHPHEFAWRNTLKSSIARLGTKKEGHTIDLLGYSATELKEHLELLFTDGMGWHNYGEWHVDHIKGIKEFNSKTPLNIVNSLSNLQPLWAIDNIIKG